MDKKYTLPSGCACGRTHEAALEDVLIGSGVIRSLPELLKKYGCQKPFLLSGHDTFAAAGRPVCSALDEAGLSCSRFVFPHSPVLPTEQSVGSAAMHFDASCDAIVSIGSGVINDIGKILAAISKKPYLIVATAPSMDGYASATSSMERDGLKVSINTVCARAVLGDTDILCQAPMRMLQSGVGDMLAKYVSLAEWQLGKIIVGEYYCPEVAQMVRRALEQVVSAADGLVKREKQAVQSVMEGLVIAGLCMQYAGLSRPASGIEHYFSHIWDMRALAFPDAKADLHGIQCGAATVLSLRVCERLKAVTPDKQKALRYASSFGIESWYEQLGSFIGPGAQAMIALDRQEGKYEPKAHEKRLERIVSHWDEILSVLDSLPAASEIERLLRSIGAPTDAGEWGYTPEQLRKTFTMTKDIRDKYIVSRLLWDLGELDQAADALFYRP